jgi:hypothetical protein
MVFFNNGNSKLMVFKEIHAEEYVVKHEAHRPHLTTCHAGENQKSSKFAFYRDHRQQLRGELAMSENTRSKRSVKPRDLFEEGDPAPSAPSRTNKKSTKTRSKATEPPIDSQQWLRQYLKAKRSKRYARTEFIDLTTAATSSNLGNDF